MYECQTCLQKRTSIKQMASPCVGCGKLLQLLNHPVTSGLPLCQKRKVYWKSMRVSVAVAIPYMH